jgi:hypothetical protein
MVLFCHFGYQIERPLVSRFALASGSVVPKGRIKLLETNPTQWRT